MDRQRVFECLMRERAAQELRRGYTVEHDEQHTAADWLAILMHELGEFADAVLNSTSTYRHRRALEKIGAVAMAALEALPPAWPQDEAGGTRQEGRGRRDEAVSETFEHGGFQFMPREAGRILSIRTPSGWQAVYETQDDGWQRLRTAITAALGDGAIVVSRERLRYALEYACHWGMQQNRSQPWAQFVTAAQSYADATIAELTAPEVEG